MRDVSVHSQASGITALYLAWYRLMHPINAKPGKVSFCKLHQQPAESMEAGDSGKHQSRRFAGRRPPRTPHLRRQPLIGDAEIVAYVLAVVALPISAVVHTDTHSLFVRAIVGFWGRGWRMRRRARRVRGRGCGENRWRGRGRG